MLEIMTSVAEQLWKMSLLSCPLIILIMLIRYLLRKYPKKYCYGLWLLVIIRLLCPVFIESNISLQPGITMYSEQTESVSTDITLPGSDSQTDVQHYNTMVPDSQSANEPDINYQQANTANTYDSTDSLYTDNREKTGANGYNASTGIPASIHKPANDSLLQKIADLLPSLYLSGICIAFIICLVQYGRIKHQVRTAIHDEGNVWLCDEIDSPFVMGILAPMIYLPYNLTNNDKQNILKHERCHIKHHDPIFRMLSTLVLCLHFWNPFVWLAVHMINEDMEIYCDEGFMLTAPLEERRAYATTLLVFAQKRSGLLPKLSFGESATEKRIKNVMKKKKRNGIVIALVALAALAAVVLLLTIPKSKDDGQPITAPTEAAKLDNDNTPKDTDNIETGTDSADKANDDVTNEADKILLSEADIAYLEKMSSIIPEFKTAADRNAEFWAYLIFDLYYRDSDGETEDTSRFSEEPGTTVTYRKVSEAEVDELSLTLFGHKMTDSVMSPEIPMNASLDIVFEDGYFYINIMSDGVEYDSTFTGLKETDDRTEAEFLIKHVDSDWQGIITLTLEKSDNKSGFVITGKALEPIAQPLGRIIESQVYNVKLNPLGDVTFVAYEPEVNEDVTFGLLMDGEEIHHFSLYDEQFYLDKRELKEIKSITFPDINSDGYEDLVIIADYYMGDYTNPSIISQAKIYTGTADGSFTWEKHLMDTYNNTHEQKTAEDIVEYAAKPENQILFKGTSILGSWEIQKVAGTSSVYSLSEEEINSYLYSYFEYNRYSLQYVVPTQELIGFGIEGYSTESINLEELLELYKLDKQPEGPVSNSFVCYQVLGMGEGNGLGDSVILIDSNNAYIYYGGVFYLAKRTF